MMGVVLVNVRGITIGTLLSATLMLAACQNDSEQQGIAAEQQLPERYVEQQQLYDEALVAIQTLHNDFDSADAQEVEAYYTNRLNVWRDVMNDYLNGLKEVYPEEQWTALATAQEEWRKNMENYANIVASTYEDEAAARTAYLTEKEQRTKVRARELLDNYYFNLPTQE